MTLCPISSKADFNVAHILFETKKINITPRTKEPLICLNIVELQNAKVLPKKKEEQR